MFVAQQNAGAAQLFAFAVLHQVPGINDFSHLREPLAGLAMLGNDVAQVGFGYSGQILAIIVKHHPPAFGRSVAAVIIRKPGKDGDDDGPVSWALAFLDLRAKAREILQVAGQYRMNFPSPARVLGPQKPIGSLRFGDCRCAVEQNYVGRFGH